MIDSNGISESCTGELSESQTVSAFASTTPWLQAKFPRAVGPQKAVAAVDDSEHDGPSHVALATWMQTQSRLLGRCCRCLDRCSAEVDLNPDLNDAGEWLLVKSDRQATGCVRW